MLKGDNRNLYDADRSSERLHGKLETIGLLPVIGDWADLANAGLYASEGNTTQAYWSIAASAPVLGTVIGIAGRAARKTIGLGLDADLALHRGTDAITYKGAGWQQAGLTKVDWGRASMDDFYFKQSFQEAAENAGAIKFNVSSFDPFYHKPGITNFEFNHIINDPSLLQKTTFTQNSNQVFWNGTQFTR